MKYTIPAVSLLFIFAVPLFSSGAGDKTENITETILVEHKLGSVEVPLQPETSVVFSYDILDLMDQWDLPVASVVKGYLPSYLSDYAGEEYIDAGTLFEPDYETLYLLKPDVIFISDRQASVYDELSKIAPVVYTTIDPASYLGSLETNWSLLGRIFGKEDAAVDSLENVRQSSEVITELSQGKSALFLLINDGALSVFGPGSRFGFLYDEFGYTPADPDIEVASHGQSVSFEYLLEKDPDYLFVLDRGAALTGKGTAESVLDNPLVHQTKAWQEEGIHYLDGAAWYLSPGGIVSTESILSDLRMSAP